MNYKKYLLFLLFIMIIGCNKTYAISENNYEINQNGIININKLGFNYDQNNLINILEVDCQGLFGNKNDPDSLSYLINDILKYARIIVPVLIIGLGMLDLAKAVIASKEDEMKKAQQTFVKRLILGVVFFFIPVFVDIIMWLADIVWNGMYTSCGL